MSTRRTIVLIMVAAALGWFGWWVAHHYSFREQRVWVGYHGEARYNSLYAARLLLEGLGYRVHQTDQLHRFEQVAPHGVLLLGAERSNLDPPTARALLAWVERGGHLIVGAEYSLGGDQLLDRLGIKASAGEGDEDSQVRDVQARDTQIDTVVLADGTALRVEVSSWRQLVDQKKQATWVHASGQSVRMLEVQHGAGRVTVLSTLRPFTNPAIGEHDHAELLARLAARGSGEVWIVPFMSAPSLWEWAWTHAAQTLIALGVFLLLWLWRVMPRFGPLYPSASLERKSLVEHLRAVGKFYAAEQLLPRMLQRVRADAQAMFDHAAPELRGADDSQRLKEAARLTRIRARELRDAFTEAPHTAKEFTHAVRTLALLRNRLRRRNSPSKLTLKDPA